jgi:UV DNA damage repair endonuclease
MDLPTDVTPAVQAATQTPKKKRAPKDVHTSAPKDDGTKKRKDGRIAATILLSTEVHEWLSWMAQTKGEDRSVLAARFILAGLARNSALAREAAEAIERLRVAALAKSDEGNDRPDAASPASNSGHQEAA